MFCLIKNERGQATVEFAAVLIFLVPLILLVFQLYEIFDTQHRVIEAARYGPWEEIEGKAIRIIRAEINEKFFNRREDNVTVSSRRQFSAGAEGAFGGVLHEVMRLFGLELDDTTIVYTVSNNYTLYMFDQIFGDLAREHPGINQLTQIKLEKQYALLSEPWKARGQREVRDTIQNMTLMGILTGWARGFLDGIGFDPVAVNIDAVSY